MPIKLQGTNSAAAPGLTNDGGDGVVVGTDSVDISIGGASKVKVDNTGSVNIGSTGGFDSNGDDLTITNASHGGISIKTGTTSDGVLRFGDGAGAAEYRGYINYRHDGDKFLIGTSATQRLSIDSDGLKFNADTAAANAISDYEEGNWTATPTNGALYSDWNGGIYIKVGKHVTVAGQIRVDGDNTNSLQISLPFTVAANSNDNNANFAGTLATFQANPPIGDTHPKFVSTGAGQSTMNFLQDRGNSTWADYGMTNNAYYKFTLTYISA